MHQKKRRFTRRGDARDAELFGRDRLLDPRLPKGVASVIVRLETGLRALVSTSRHPLSEAKGYKIGFASRD